MTGGDALPTILGTLGNPTQLFLANSNVATQVFGVRGDSPALATPTITEPAADQSTGQIWRFQLVGWIGMHTYETNSAWRGDLQQVPVYKVINYHSDGSHTCLDATGGTGAAGSSVLSNLCDPYSFNQTNQLWVVGDTDALTNIIYVGGQYPATIPLQLSALQDSNRTVLENVASLQANNWDTSTAPVLSAAPGVVQGSAGNIQGSNSPLSLQDQRNWPVTQANSTWIVHNIVPTAASNGSGSNSGPSCTMFACMFPQLNSPF